jgi:multisubunit Na+/H+ antiporter MnhB subunit
VRALHGLYLFLTGLWGGVLLAFTLGAGLVLRSAPSRQVGGIVNRALLDALDVLSYVAVGLLFALFLALRRREDWPKLTRILTPRLLVLMGVATIASHLLVTPEMVSLRDRMVVAVDLVPKEDPLRREWGRLHGISSLLLLGRLLGVANLFALGFWAVPVTTYVVRPEDATPSHS